MARTKAGDFTPYQKLLTLMQEGDVVTKDEIESKLGNDEANPYWHGFAFFLFVVKRRALTLRNAFKREAS